jgi:hypothetical protein
MLDKLEEAQHRGVGSQRKDSLISKMFWLSFAAMFAMARAPHCCPSSVPLVSIAVRPGAWVWSSMSTYV